MRLPRAAMPSPDTTTPLDSLPITITVPDESGPLLRGVIRFTEIVLVWRIFEFLRTRLDIEFTANPAATVCLAVALCLLWFFLLHRPVFRAMISGELIIIDGESVRFLFGAREGKPRRTAALTDYSRVEMFTDRGATDKRISVPETRLILRHRTDRSFDVDLLSVADAAGALEAGEHVARLLRLPLERPDESAGGDAALPLIPGYLCRVRAADFSVPTVVIRAEAGPYDFMVMILPLIGVLHLLVILVIALKLGSGMAGLPLQLGLAGAFIFGRTPIARAVWGSRRITMTGAGVRVRTSWMLIPWWRSTAWSAWSGIQPVKLHSLMYGRTPYIRMEIVLIHATDEKRNLLVYSSPDEDDRKQQAENLSRLSGLPLLDEIETVDPVFKHIQATIPKH